MCIVATVGDTSRPFCIVLGIEERIASELEESGHEVVRASGLVWTNALATREARRVADERPELTVFNCPVWTFPHFTMLAAKETPGPLLLFSSIDPGQPGMVGMLAAAGALDQIGCVYGRTRGEIHRTGYRLEHRFQQGRAKRREPRGL